MHGEQWDIAAALAQGRQRQGDNGQAEKEVLPELPCFGERGNIPVGRADDADSRRQPLIAADARELAVLQQTLQA